MTPCQTAGKRIFHDAGQSRVGHHETTYSPSVETVCEQSEGVGVALEVGDVVPESFSYAFLQVGSCTLGEEGLYGFLAAVPEWRVAHVVCQACRADDGSYLFERCSAQFGMLLAQLRRHVIAQRHAYRGHLQRVGEAVVHEDGTGKGKHLRLVLHASERCGENKAVVVAFKLRPVVMTFGVLELLAKPFIGN